MREDQSDALVFWKVVDPILGNVTPLFPYDPNTWGPTEAERIRARDGGWHNPLPTTHEESSHYHSQSTCIGEKKR